MLTKARMRASGQVTGATLGSGWLSLGPLPLPSDASGTGLQDYGWVSGRATAVAIDPNDASGNTVFAGASDGGLWKSVNAGALSGNPDAVVWTSLTDDQPTLAIGAIAVQPQSSSPDPNRSVVLVGTGETNSSVNSFYGLGILRSADGGQTWALISQDASGAHSFVGIGFSQIAFSSANPNLAVAAAGSASEGVIEGLDNSAGSNRGVYYSSDGGASWNAASIADGGNAISPGSVTSVAYNAAAGRFYAAIRFHGFYSSSDGIHWTRLNAQPGLGLSTISCPPGTQQPSACSIYRGQIAIVPNRAGKSGAGEMYVWYIDGNEVDQGIWVSLDGGATWSAINDSGIANCGDLLGGCGTQNASDGLTLAAVPDGTATDLYAGATNLFRCTITNAFPACNGTGKNTFFNLTHVYGCSDIAKVHPGQHAIDFLVNGGTSLLFFANDGGIYRSLDGFTGLLTGACGSSNQFDSLNRALGPLTQFVSVAQSSTDANVIFGGTHENGVPATVFAQSGGNWMNVDAGDVGHTLINPSDDNDWFIATPPNSISGVNILRCTSGINCHTQDFAGNQIVDSSMLAGDVGPFDLPFILDPGSSGALLIGTCRVWRGSLSSSFSMLSPDFENGGNGICTGTETNLVRAIAAGGPSDSNGYAQVIYAATDGQGPITPAVPAGGRVWVSTTSSGGPQSWADRTGSINPQGFPIASVAIDQADQSGRTAYIGIMGFHASHVWKTTDAGISWTDFTSNLPDTPVNSIAIDSGATTNSGIVYVGTDVGVFASGTVAASWSEVAPPAGPGFLPNVAVTDLKIFNVGGFKFLRAATYGRGIWQWNLITTPDFQITVSNNPQTVFAGQAVTYNGTIFARNAYGSVVNLTCTQGSTQPPQSCIVSPASIMPTAQGAAFSVSAADAPGDYAFNLQGAGTDPSTITHQSPLVLHVIDFTLSSPSPASVNVAPGATSAPVSFTLSAGGAFNGQVTLSCLGLPPGAACQFQPSILLSPTSSAPVSVGLAVSSLVTSPPGTYQLTVSASSPGGKTKSQLLILSVNFVPDYILAVSNSPQTAPVNTTATFNGTLTSVNGYGSPVNLTCGSGAPANCTIIPATVTPSDTGAPFLITLSSAVSQAFAFNVNAAGTDVLAVSHSAPIAFTAMPAQPFDFTLQISPGSVSVPSGQSAAYSLSVSPNKSAFPGNVTFSCSGAPALTTCAFSPSQLGTGSGSATVTITATTTAPTPAFRHIMALWFYFPLAAVVWMNWTKPRTSRRAFSASMLLLVISLGGSSCGGGLQGNGSIVGTGSPGTPAGTYNLQITVAATSITHTAQVKLVVTQ